MPIINGQKVACAPCIRGHRSTKCTHFAERVMVPVRKPGRPLTSCACPPGRPCGCGGIRVAIPRKQKCGCGTPSDDAAPTPSGEGSAVVKRDHDHDHDHDHDRDHDLEDKDDETVPDTQLEPSPAPSKLLLSPTKSTFRVSKPSPAPKTNPRRLTFDPVNLDRVNPSSINIVRSCCRGGSAGAPPLPSASTACASMPSAQEGHVSPNVGAGATMTYMPGSGGVDFSPNPGMSYSAAVPFALPSPYGQPQTHHMVMPAQRTSGEAAPMPPSLQAGHAAGQARVMSAGFHPDMNSSGNNMVHLFGVSHQTSNPFAPQHPDSDSSGDRKSSVSSSDSSSSSVPVVPYKNNIAFAPRQIRSPMAPQQADGTAAMGGGGCCGERKSSASSESSTSPPVSVPYNAMAFAPQHVQSVVDMALRHMQPSNVQFPTVFTYPAHYGSWQHPISQETWHQVASQASLSLQGGALPVAGISEIADALGADQEATSHECSCGPGCRCVGCLAHPFNDEMFQYVTDAYNMDTNHAAAATTTTTNGTRHRHQNSIGTPIGPGPPAEVGGGGDGGGHPPPPGPPPAESPTTASQAPQHAGGTSAVIASPPLSISPSESSSSFLGEDRCPEQSLPSSDYFFVNFPYYDPNGCGGHEALCPCGDGCLCVGCQVHSN